VIGSSHPVLTLVAGQLISMFHQVRLGVLDHGVGSGNCSKVRVSMK